MEWKRKKGGDSSISLLRACLNDLISTSTPRLQSCTSSQQEASLYLGGFRDILDLSYSTQTHCILLESCLSCFCWGGSAELCSQDEQLVRRYRAAPWVSSFFCLPTLVSCSSENFLKLKRKRKEGLEGWCRVKNTGCHCKGPRVSSHHLRPLTHLQDVCVHTYAGKALRHIT